MNKEKLPCVLAGLSVLAAVLAGFVFLTQNSIFGIAGTQWILIAILLGVYANHALNCPSKCGESCCSKPEVK